MKRVKIAFVSALWVIPFITMAGGLSWNDIKDYGHQFSGWGSEADKAYLQIRTFVGNDSPCSVGYNLDQVQYRFCYNQDYRNPYEWDDSCRLGHMMVYDTKQEACRSFRPLNR